MSNMRLSAVSVRSAALACAGVFVVAGLSACEERPYSVPVRTAPYAPPRAQGLAGAPTRPSGYALPAADDGQAAPYGAPAQTYAEAASAYPPPSSRTQTYRPAPAYDTGGPMIVAMAPIPNPAGEASGRRTVASTGAPRPVHAHHAARQARAPSRHASGPRLQASANHPAHRAPAVAAVAAAPKTAPVTERHTATTAPHPAATASNPVHASAPAPAPAPAPAQAPAKAVATAPEAKTIPAPAPDAKLAAAKPVDSVAVAAAKPAPAAPAIAKPAAAAPSTGADRTTRLAALQAALTDAVSKTGVLTTPAQFTANQPADVSLTLPAAFAETVRKEADRQGLSEEAASVNMTALLAGDSVSATPADMQSQPLTIGQPTEFHWTVVAKPGDPQPLRADVGANLLGGGSEVLSLGTVQKSPGGRMAITPRAVGAGILALIVVLVLGWLARGLNTPLRTASARRAAARRARGERPLDMSTDGDAAR